MGKKEVDFTIGRLLGKLEENPHPLDPLLQFRTSTETGEGEARNQAAPAGAWNPQDVFPSF